MFRSAATAFSIAICSSLVTFAAVPKFDSKVEREQTRADLTVVGNVILWDGLGRQSLELINELKDSLKISFIPINRIDADTMKEIHPNARKILNCSGIVNQGKVLILESCVCDPSYKIDNTWSFMRFGLPRTSSSQIRYAYSVFESTRLPPNWVEIFNKHFDGVLVADPFLVDVYKKSGVTVPVFFLPLGVNIQDFLETPIKTTRNSPMVFANFGVCATRKNSLTLIRAFARAFGNDPRAKLILGWKMIWERPYRNLVLAEIAKLGLHNVEIQERCLSRTDYLQRFRKVDCYVSLSTREGFSIQPREAMALGIPSIISNSTAQRTICSSGLVRTVAADMLIPGKYIWGIFGNYEDCTVSDAANAMLDVYNNYDLYLAKSEAARRWVSQYNYPNLRSHYLSIARPKAIALGTTNTIEADKIITNDKSLFEKYMTIFPSLKKTKKDVEKQEQRPLITHKKNS